MTRIGWVTDETCNKGGRQFTIKNFRDKAPDDVELIDFHLEKPEETEECDMYIIHSVSVPKNLSLFPKSLKPGMSKPRPVIMYVHQWDVWSFGANAVIYQSPLHATQNKFGQYHVIPPAITSDEVVYEGEDKESVNANLWLGTFNPENGGDIAVRVGESEKTPTHFFGYDIPQNTTQFSQLMGELPHSEMPEVYNKYKRLVYYPRQPQPFGRAIAEALLAGLEVKVSGKIGIESFDKSIDEVAESTFESSKEFWKLISGYS